MHTLPKMKLPYDARREKSAMPYINKRGSACASVQCDYDIFVLSIHSTVSIDSVSGTRRS